MLKSTLKAIGGRADTETTGDAKEYDIPNIKDVRELTNKWGWKEAPKEALLLAAQCIDLQHRQHAEIIQTLGLLSQQEIAQTLESVSSKVAPIEALAGAHKRVRDRINLIQAFHLGVQYTEMPGHYFTPHPDLNETDVKEEAKKYFAFLTLCQDATPVLVFSDAEDYKRFERQTGPARAESALRRKYPALVCALGPRNTVLKALDTLNDTGAQEDLAAVKVAHSSALREDRQLQILDKAFAQALGDGSTDIHIIVRSNGHPAVMYRVMRDVEEMPLRLSQDDYSAIKSYLLKTSDAQKNSAMLVDPADGRFQYIDNTGNVVNVRASFIPSSHVMVHGAPAVSIRLRLQKLNDTVLRLEEMGLHKKVRDTINAAIRQTQGIILLVGPTNSGKSTTISGLLEEHREIYGITRSRISAEDPVERFLTDVDQFEIPSHRRGKDGFSVLCKNFMRHDPDLIFVGEIRDAETAEYAVQFGETGHLVVSTLHAKTGATAPQRLINMLPPEKTMLKQAAMEALNVVLGQRLIKKICQECSEPLTELSAEEAEEIGAALSIKGLDMDIPKAHRRVNPEGCQHCRKGITGILPINDVLVFTDELRDELMRSPDQIVTICRKRTLVSFEEMALEYIEAGLSPYDSLVI
jgi:type II secretory ATPase GspE/PulE/Tfp pilus assembly ATPase PilB-like protein